ncbi:MAG: thioredoxin family protein [Melioribacteraceae bacterium]|nr:thioredoxin family protein [Melioribacteraceae bacterium]
MILNKHIIIVFFLLSSSSDIFSQEYRIFQDNENDPIIVGISARDVYQDSIYASWYNFEYTNYKLNTKLLYNNKSSFENKIIKIVLGTWCIDSKREVPRFVKILDFLEFPSDKILFINVDREKRGLYNEVEDINIEFVPTFIVYEDGKEIGRIIESPINSLEEDLIKIVAEPTQ